MIFSKINRKQQKKKPRHKNDIETFYSNFGVNNTRKKLKAQIAYYYTAIKTKHFSILYTLQHLNHGYRSSCISHLLYTL